MHKAKLFGMFMLICIMILGFSMQGNLFSSTTIYAQGNGNGNGRGRGDGGDSGGGSERGRGNGGGSGGSERGNDNRGSSGGSERGRGNGGDSERGNGNGGGNGGSQPEPDNNRDNQDSPEDNTNNDDAEVIFVPVNCDVQAGSESEIILPEECDDVDSEQVNVCHVEGDVTDPASYETLSLHISEVGNHFHADGSPQMNHLNDTFGYCPSVAPQAPRPVIPGIAPTFQPLNVGAPVCTDWFVYHTNRTDNWEIFRSSNTPETNVVNISQGDGVDVAPSLSPDREWIVFTSNRDGNWELYVARTDGSMVQRVTNTLEAEVDPAWSPIDSQVLYERISANGSRSLYLLDLSTAQVAPIAVGDWHDINPSWSPDGSRFVFESNRDGIWQIYEYNLATQQLQRMTTVDEHYSDSVYSASGAYIAYRAQLASGRSVIRVMNSDGTDVRNITAELMNVNNHVWSPDDSAIAYEANVDGDRDIFVFELATEQTRRVTANQNDEYAPTWLCDTQTILFTATINNNSDIYAVNAFPMTASPVQGEQGATRWTTDPAADQYPVQSPTEENASRPQESRLN